MPTLSARGLSKHFGRRKVVSNVDITVETGTIVGLLGPNGAGKTTSFYMIAGLVSPDSGMICIDDRDITHLPMHARARLGLGYLPQEPSIFRKLSVAENLRAVLQLRPELSAGQRELIIDELLDEFSVHHLRHEQASGLSGGERRRVEIARALATEPRFILLDEPFAGVDPLSILDIRNIIQHLSQRGIGILITEHNVRETLSICSRAYILNNGAVIAEGGAQEVIEHEEVRKVYLGEHFSL